MPAIFSHLSFDLVFYSVYDLRNIQESGALFVRKVATAIDPNMYHILPVDNPTEIPPIDWPTEVQVSAVPNWEKKLAQYKQRANQRKETKKPVGVEEEEDKSSSDDTEVSNGAAESERELL